MKLLAYILIIKERPVPHSFCIIVALPNDGVFTGRDMS